MKVNKPKKNKLLFKCNSEQTVALGFIQKEPKAYINIDVDYLELAVKLLKESNMKIFKVCIFSEDDPLLIGLNEEENLYTGVLIAPRISVKEEDRVR